MSHSLTQTKAIQSAAHSIADLRNEMNEELDALDCKNVTTKYGSTYTNTPCGRTICNAENDLGPLSFGQKADLLLDNHMEIDGVAESRDLVKLVTVAITGCETCGAGENMRDSDECWPCYDRRIADGREQAGLDRAYAEYHERVR